MMKTSVVKLGGLVFLASFLGCRIVDRPVEPAADFGAAVQKFSASRQKLAQDLSSRLNLPLPSQADAFFRVAVTGNWESVSNHFAQVQQRSGYGSANPQLQNELWAPIHETMGVWEVWAGWKEDSSLLALFYEPVLSSMPKGSIYFGGTDHGRFVITTVNALQEPPPIFCITQNALADETYAAHLRAIYGDSIWIPKKEDSMQAFQQYMNEVLSGKHGTNGVIMTADGRVQVSGVLGVMELNGILCRMIFDHNKDSHEFFVEESYIIDWMYPYLEPCGLIMKLNTRELDRLDDNTVQRDQKFWREYVVRLQRHPRFGENPEAQKAFAKQRCAIASIYVFRKRYEDAQAAFYEAMKLCPVCPEVSFRLARLYEEQGKMGAAIGVLKKYIALDAQTLVRYGEINPLYSQVKARDYVRELEEKYKRSSTVIQTDAEQPPAN